MAKMIVIVELTPEACERLDISSSLRFKGYELVEDEVPEDRNINLESVAERIRQDGVAKLTDFSTKDIKAIGTLLVFNRKLNYFSTLHMEEVQTEVPETGE